MAIKAGRKTRNPLDRREMRTARGTRTNRRMGTKSRAARQQKRRSPR